MGGARGVPTLEHLPCWVVSSPCRHSALGYTWSKVKGLSGLTWGTGARVGGLCSCSGYHGTMMNWYNCISFWLFGFYMLKTSFLMIKNNNKHTIKHMRNRKNHAPLKPRYSSALANIQCLHSFNVYHTHFYILIISLYIVIRGTFNIIT